MIFRLEVANSDVSLSPNEATLWMNREQAVVVLDIREKEKFTAGHIAGAKHVKPEFPEKNSPWDKFKKKKIILVCADGRVSKRIRDKLAATIGHQNVKYLNGGMQAWADENLPVEV